MGSIVRGLIEGYTEALPGADARTQDWLLVNRTAIPVWTLTVLYLGFLWLGPKYMKHRSPFQLTNFMIVYNLSLAVLSLYMFVEISVSTYDAGYSFGCTPYNDETVKDPKELRVARVFWWYFFSKAIELIDTVMMVLRKKNNQITFLHVYHHAVMLNIWWWVMAFIPGGLTWFGPWINSLIHIFMYAYYGLSVIPSMRSKLWWKRYLTQLQLIQFFCTIAHTFYSMTLNCDFPQWGQNLLAGLMISLILLFANFYRQTYVPKPSRRKEAAYTNAGTMVQSEVTRESNGVLSNGTSDVSVNTTNNNIFTNGKVKSN